MKFKKTVFAAVSIDDTRQDDACVDNLLLSTIEILRCKVLEFAPSWIAAQFDTVIKYLGAHLGPRSDLRIWASSFRNWIFRSWEIAKSKPPLSVSVRLYNMFYFSTLSYLLQLFCPSKAMLQYERYGGVPFVSHLGRGIRTPAAESIFWASRDRACLGPLDDAPKVDFDRMSQLKAIFPCIQN